MIEIRDEVHDLKSVLWRFTVMSSLTGQIIIKLEEFAVCERQTKRHKWKKAKYWSQTDERWSSIKREQVPALPDFIKNRALRALEIKFEQPHPKKEVV